MAKAQQTYELKKRIRRPGRHAKKPNKRKKTKTYFG